MKSIIPKKFDVFLADLNPQFGTEPGKIRPVVIVQTDLLNDIHPSVIICPLTSNITAKSEILRVHINKSDLSPCGLTFPSDILIDQIRAIDKKRLTERIGVLPKNLQIKVIKSLNILIIN